MDIKELYNQRTQLETLVNNTSIRLNSYSKHANGLIIDTDSADYIRDYNAYNRAFSMLQAFNKALTEKQKIELRDYKRQLRGLNK